MRAIIFVFINHYPSYKMETDLLVSAFLQQRTLEAVCFVHHPGLYRGVFYILTTSVAQRE